MTYRVPVRWDALFADLQAQLEAEQRTDHDVEIRDLAEAEVAGTRFADRLRALVGGPLTVRLIDGSDWAGMVADAAPEWLLLAQGERRHLVPAAAIALAWPLAGIAPAAGRVESRLGLGSVLRALAAEGQAVMVRTRAGDHNGLLVRVGADHLDVAAAAGVLSVPWSALLSVSSL